MESYFWLPETLGLGLSGMVALRRHFKLVLPRRGLKAASRTSRAVLKPSQAAVTALAYDGLALA